MLTRKEFRLPEEPQFTGDPREDVKRIRDHVTACNKAQIEFWRSLNTPEMLSIDMANMRAAYGVVFPATQNAIADVNTLDDYEEGSTAPTPVPGAGAFTTATAGLNYTKIGNRVLIDLVVSITTNGTGATSVKVALPFTPAVVTGFGGVESAATGWGLCGYFNTDGFAYIFKYDGTYPGANGRDLRISDAYKI